MVAPATAKLNLKTIGLLGRAKLIPFSLDNISRRLSITRNKRDLWLWKILACMCGLDALGLIIPRFLQYALYAIFPPPSFKLETLCIHFMHCMGAFFCFFGISQILYLNGKNYSLVLNEFGFATNSEHAVTRGNGTKDKGDTSQLEFTLATLPASTATLGFAIASLILLSDSSGYYLIYSLLPSSLQSPLMYVLLAPVELLLLAVYFSAYYMAMYGIVGFQLHFMEDIEGLQLAGIATNGIPMDLFRKLIKLQVEVKIFNQVFASFNYLLKVGLLCISIICTFAGIKFYTKYPFIGGIMFFVGASNPPLYDSLYGTMFKVPEGVQAAKRSILLGLGRMEKSRKQACRRRLEAIGPCGIRAGHFYIFGRESSPEFTDFVVTQVVSLLLTL